MTLVSQISDLTTRIGTEFKTVYSRQGALGSLTTTDKTSLVAAVNEVKAATASAAGINDATTTTTTTWSSSKTSSSLALKANLASPTFTGTVAGITAAMVGLGSVDNTSDAAKPVSTAQQTALNLKANLASPTFTGTTTVAALTATGAVTGITKAHVGLSNVDNTADTAKPVSTAQATAIAALINDASLTTATTTTYSANKINGAISTAVSNLVAASPAALDTLNELAAAIGNDANFASTTATALGNRLKVDGTAQVIAGANQTIARDNIGAQAAATIGDPATDFVAVFNAALI